MLKDLLLSTIRTVVPTVVAFLVAFFADFGIEIDKSALGTVLAGLFVGAYYVLARLLEKVHPWFGVLLGATTQPTYQSPRQDLPAGEEDPLS